MCIGRLEEAARGPARWISVVAVGKVRWNDSNFVLRGCPAYLRAGEEKRDRGRSDERLCPEREERKNFT